MPETTAALFWGPEQALLSRLLEIAVSLLVLTLGFSLLFKYVPDAEIRWRDVWPGGVLTAVLFSILLWIVNAVLHTIESRLIRPA